MVGLVMVLIAIFAILAAFTIVAGVIWGLIDVIKKRRRRGW